ncbi:MAG: ribosome biogenesis GTPase YlqF [Gammaproteobacteria bacterium]|nr:ribosome biogenesis GTPase YlqF [Gammaproteobacteria bacterium]
MAIQWYPGHMHKARKKIVEAMPKIDIVIEVMDARLPFSSENPLVTELRGNRPCIKILNKSDLADPLVTKAWLDHLEQERGVKALAMTSEKPGQIRKISSICRQMLPKKVQKEQRIRTMIMGIPNVGKSTLINILTGKIIAKVGNEPAVTKSQQKIYLDNGIVLSDTPGILWPKIEDENSGYRLAVTGAIKNTAIEYEDIALYAAGFLLESYPQRVMDRYKLKKIPESDEQLLDIIGRKRGGLRPGGVVDLHKASEVLIHDLRSGALGRVSLEHPV